MYKKSFLIILVCFYSLLVISQGQVYFNNTYSYNGNYTIGMTIIDNGDGFLGYGATDDIGIYQMLFLYKISYTGEMQTLKTFYEPGTTFYPGNVGGAMIETWDNKLALAYHYSLSGISYGALMKVDNNLDTIWKKSYTPAYNTITLNCFEALDKGYLLTGWIFQEEKDFSDAILLKTDSLGNYQWHQLYGGNWAEHGENTIQTPDGGYLIGGYFWKPGYDHSQDAMVIKTDSLGNEQWTKYYGNPDVDDDMVLVAMADDGNYLVATVYGEWIHTPMIRTGRLYLLKIDDEGNTIWDKKIGPKRRSINIKNIRHTLDGNLVATGWSYTDTISEFIYEGWIYKFTQEGDSIWWRDYYHYHNQYDRNFFYDVSPTSDNGYIAIGKARPNQGGSTNKMWIVKVDSLGCDTPGCATGTFVEELFPYVRDWGEDLKVYPNPVNKKLKVKSLKLKVTGTKVINIYNSQGIKVDKIIVPDRKETITIDVQGRPGGMYFVQLNVNGIEAGSAKFIKM
jgi:hypothetical protein